MEVSAQFTNTIGVLVISNVAVLISVIVFIFKAGMFVSETRTGITKAQETSNRAHSRIDRLEDKHS